MRIVCRDRPARRVRVRCRRFWSGSRSPLDQWASVELRAPEDRQSRLARRSTRSTASAAHRRPAIVRVDDRAHE